MKTKDKSKRILTFDLMRGWFLLAIIIDHITYFPCGLEWLSARGGLYVTCAEGFFFISGIVLGIVRGCRLIDKPFREVAKLLLKRAMQLYIWSVFLTIVFTLITWNFYPAGAGAKPGVMSIDTPIWKMILSAFSLDYFYGWADYLRLYAIFMFISPLVFWLLRKGKWYVVVVVSLAVWSLFPSGQPWNIQEKIQPISWQFIFFSGSIVGFYWNKITEWWRSHPIKKRRATVRALCAIGGVTLVFNVLIMFSTMGNDLSWLGIYDGMSSELYRKFFDKMRMPLSRFALFLTWFWMFFNLFRRFEKQIIKYAGWILLPFGQNSLYVYTLHAFGVYFIHIYTNSGTWIQNFAIVGGLIAIIWLMIRYKVLMKIIPR